MSDDKSDTYKRAERLLSVADRAFPQLDRLALKEEPAPLVVAAPKSIEQLAAEVDLVGDEPATAPVTAPPPAPEPAPVAPPPAPPPIVPVVVARPVKQKPARLAAMLTRPARPPTPEPPPIVASLVDRVRDLFSPSLRAAGLDALSERAHSGDYWNPAVRKFAIGAGIATGVAVVLDANRRATDAAERDERVAAAAEWFEHGLDDDKIAEALTAGVSKQEALARLAAIDHKIDERAALRSKEAAARARDAATAREIDAMRAQIGSNAGRIADLGVAQATTSAAQANAAAATMNLHAETARQLADDREIAHHREVMGRVERDRAEKRAASHEERLGRDLDDVREQLRDAQSRPLDANADEPAALPAHEDASLAALERIAASLDEED
jgi:hypothetical protein